MSKKRLTFSGVPKGSLTWYETATGQIVQVEAHTTIDADDAVNADWLVRSGLATYVGNSDGKTKHEKRSARSRPIGENEDGNDDR